MESSQYTMLLLGFTIVSIIFAINGIFKTASYRAKIRRLEGNLKLAEDYGRQMFANNETLKVYHDNQHHVWWKSHEDFFFKKQPDNGLVVLIDGRDLYELVTRQWQEGYTACNLEAGRKIQLLYRQLNELDGEENPQNVVTMRASFGDKKFNHEFAKFVNELTSTAVDYSQSQQLRTHISQVVLDFRLHLSKKQVGEESTFPSN